MPAPETPRHPKAAAAASSTGGSANGPSTGDALDGSLGNSLGAVQVQHQIAERVREIAAELQTLVARLQPENVPVSWAPGIMSTFVKAERAAAAGRLLLTSRAAEANEWKRRGFASPADWLAFDQGTSAGRARAELSTSDRLQGLEATSDALRDGRLSPDEAGAIADAAVVNPDAEQDLVDLANQESLRNLQDEAARRKAEAESEEAKRKREERIRKNRSVTTYTKDGAGHLRAVGPLAQIAELSAAIQSIVQKRFATPTPVADREGPNAYAFDALIDLARHARSGSLVASGDRSPAHADRADGADGADSTDSDSNSDSADGVAQDNAGASGDHSSGNARRTKRAPAKHLMLLRVDLAALLRGHVSTGEMCEIAGLGPISVTEARNLFGESLLGLIMTNGPAVVDVVNLSRKPTVAQQLAKLWSDPGCTVAGCNRTAGIEFDHRADWAKTHTTTLDQLDRLCTHHHDLKTFEGWQLEPGIGRRRMVPPDDAKGRTSAAKRHGSRGDPPERQPRTLRSPALAPESESESESTPVPASESAPARAKGQRRREPPEQLPLVG